MIYKQFSKHVFPSLGKEIDIFLALYGICFKIKQNYNSRSEMQNWSVILKNTLQLRDFSQNQCKLLSLKNSKLANGNL